MSNRLQNAALVLAGLVVWHLPAAAQVTVGQNVEMTSGGDLSVGYSGFNGNQDVSSHSLNLGGQGWLRGFYYKPQFLAFDFQPYYHRSQSNSIYQTITNGADSAPTVRSSAAAAFLEAYHLERLMTAVGNSEFPASPVLPHTETGIVSM